MTVSFISLLRIHRVHDSTVGYDAETGPIVGIRVLGMSLQWKPYVS